ncbi:MAG: DUF6057 family protein [Bacteroidia bacterium]|nr:DUF6057 family protein [Bacteroidia bacterium]
MKNKFLDKYSSQIAAGAAFLSSFCFFLTAYPAHLMRREQQSLFLYDWQYITRTYKGSGWLSRFIADFIDQFLYFPVVGPILIALILTATGLVVYKICRHGIGKWASLGIAALFFGWSFMRETANLHLTQYSITALGYLSLILAALQFKKKWVRPLAAALFITAGVFLFGNPYHENYGPLWGTPQPANERLVALDVATAREQWDKVLELSEKDLRVNEACYFYNLALAKKGLLGSGFFNHSQNYTNGLFLWVSENSQFTNSVAGEVWYHLGDMTLAEQSAIIAFQQAPHHTGARYLVRLAQITLINGEYGAAMKYLNMLSRTLKYRKWALKMMPENHGSETSRWLAEARANLAGDDLVYANTLAFREILHGLLKANPDNIMARQYLLMYDLLKLELADFIDDYKDKMISGSIYEQGVLIWLSLNNLANDEEAAKYGIREETKQKLSQFYRFPDKYRNTYWYYYQDLTTQKR